MARLYKVSADTSEKEKIIGGVLTAAQGIWLALGALIATGIFLSLINILPAAFALVIGILPGGAFGLLFAFYQKEQLPLMTYLMYKRSFGKKTNYLINTAHEITESSDSGFLE